MKINYNKVINYLTHILAVLVITLFAISLTPKTLQNDTFYTIKIGEQISQNTSSIADIFNKNSFMGMQDPFSWHANLPYTYPHWLYDVLTYKVFNIGGFYGIYISTCLLAIALGLIIYFVNNKLNKNKIIAFFITVFSLYCLKDFIAARAQLVTFILFVLSIYGIEKFIETRKIRYAFLLIISPILIANMHAAVWPFYFILYLPYFGEHVINLLAKIDYKTKFKLIKDKFSKNKERIELSKEEKRKQSKQYASKIEEKVNNGYKINMFLQKHILGLGIIFIICLFTGLATPIGDTPYTYLIKTSQGNTTQNINEHLPLTLINNVNMIIVLCISIGVLTFTKVKIRLRDAFMLFGLIVLAFISQRQFSMLVLIGNFIIGRLLINLLCNIKNRLKENNFLRKNQYQISIIIYIFVVGLILLASITNIKKKMNNTYINSSSYPIEAAKYINETLIPEVGIENLKLYNEYNYGSYLLYQNIPVFIDSRADLYTPEFNGKKNEKGEYEGRDIFTDFLNISSLTSSYETEFTKYGITHVITYSNSKLNSLLQYDANYLYLYGDDDFVIYERMNR